MQKETFLNWKKNKNKLQKQAKQHFKNTVNLKQANELSSLAHHKVFSETDCLQCGNCCRSIPPIVNQKDANRISKHLGIGLGEFMVKYIVIDEDGDTVMNASPCPFLNTENNECKIYEQRPKACKKYPHTDRDFSKNIELHTQNINYCPAVYSIVSRLLKK